MIKNRNILNIGIILSALMIIIIMFVIIFINDNRSQNLQISGKQDISGLNCNNNQSLNMIMQGYQPVSYNNTITAAFMDKKLVSITFAFKGEYSDFATANNARSSAEGKYNITMTEQYGLDIADFTRNISVSKNTVYVSVTSTNTENLNTTTAPIFMLKGVDPFPLTMDEMKAAYESIGFTCENKD